MNFYFTLLLLEYFISEFEFERVCNSVDLDQNEKERHTKMGRLIPEGRQIFYVCSGDRLFTSGKSDSLWWIRPDEDLHPVHHLSHAEALGIDWPWSWRATREPGTKLLLFNKPQQKLFLLAFELCLSSSRMYLWVEFPLTGSPGSCRAPSWRQR